MNPRILSTLECRLGELRSQLAGMLHKYPMSKEDREDLAQEVLLQAYSRLHDTFAMNNDAITNVENEIECLFDSRLIATIAKRRWVDSIRRAKDPARSALTNQFERPEDDTSAGLAETATESVHSRASENPADEYLRKERTSYLRSQLNTAELVLLARVADGWTDRDIAQRQRIEVTAAKSRIQDMKKKCRRILAAYDARPE